mgnify:FL=1
MEMPGLRPSVVARVIDQCSDTTLKAVLVEAGLRDVDPTRSALADYVREFRHARTTALSIPSVLLIGPSEAGKSTLLERWVTGRFVDTLDSTDGFELCEYHHHIHSNTCRVAFVA